MTDLARVVTLLSRRLAAGGGLLLLSDYDGTLSPIVADPARARLRRKVRQDLRRLARSPRVRLGILSGRALRDLQRRVGVPRAIYAGCHGFEAKGPGISFTHPLAEARRPTIEAVTRALRRRVTAIPGARVEPKGLAVAVHYRQAGRGARRRLEAVLKGLLRGRTRQLRLLRGEKVIEIMPRVRWDKGRCALWILDRVRRALGKPLSLLYMGDDRTDEHAFKALRARGVTVKVGSGRLRSTAAYHLRGVPEVHRLLAALAAAAGIGYHRNIPVRRNSRP